MKKLILVALVMWSSVGICQQSINDYKYALVPAKFDFLDEADQYKLNTYTKMFLQKYGFETYFNNETLPEEAATYNCNKVYVDVLDNSNIRNTKLTVVLKDCRNNVIFTSAEGKSAEKQYK